MSDDLSDEIAAEVGNVTEFILGLMKERTPEKAALLQQVVDAHRITFYLNEDEERVFFDSNSTSGVINIGLNGTARLMAHSYAYLSANFAFIERMRSQAEHVDIPADYDRRIRAANELLTWAVTKDVKCKMPKHAQSVLADYLPDDLVSLLEKCLTGRHQDRAGELFANALVWILYHEVAHIQSGDVGCEGYESIEQEKRADRVAADWMVGSDTLDDAEQWKRQVGIATALGWLTTPTVYLGPGRMRTHPLAHDRFFQIVDHVTGPDQQDVWLFAQMILTLHVLNRGLKIDEGRMGENLRDNCNYLIDLISKLPAR